ncbi:unnamed protein product, partial [Nesidiocoris tenuis]
PVPTWFDVSGYAMEAEENEAELRVATRDLLQIIDKLGAEGIPRNRIVIGESFLAYGMVTTSWFDGIRNGRKLEDVKVNYEEANAAAAYVVSIIDEIEASGIPRNRIFIGQGGDQDQTRMWKPEGGPGFPAWVSARNRSKFRKNSIGELRLLGPVAILRSRRSRFSKVPPQGGLLDRAARITNNLQCHCHWCPNASLQHCSSAVICFYCLEMTYTEIEILKATSSQPTAALVFLHGTGNHNPTLTVTTFWFDAVRTGSDNMDVEGSTKDADEVSAKLEEIVSKIEATGIPRERIAIVATMLSSRLTAITCRTIICLDKMDASVLRAACFRQQRTPAMALNTPKSKFSRNLAIKNLLCLARFDAIPLSFSAILDSPFAHLGMVIIGISNLFVFISYLGTNEEEIQISLLLHSFPPIHGLCFLFSVVRHRRMIDRNLNEIVSIGECLKLDQEFRSIKLLIKFSSGLLTALAVCVIAIFFSSTGLAMATIQVLWLIYFIYIHWGSVLFIIYISVGGQCLRHMSRTFAGMAGHEDIPKNVTQFVKKYDQIMEISQFINDYYGIGGQCLRHMRKTFARMPGREDITKNVAQFVKKYDQIMEISQFVNDYYGPRNLCSLTFALNTLIFQSYFLITNHMSPLKKTDNCLSPYRTTDRHDVQTADRLDRPILCQAAIFIFVIRIPMDALGYGRHWSDKLFHSHDVHQRNEPLRTQIGRYIIFIYTPTWPQLVVFGEISSGIFPAPCGQS